ncbi:MAG: TatD family hydrolase [Patescibacteria group bacterium]|nr:TatD family hydrolase [Patescibacteria group bacterium]
MLKFFDAHTHVQFAAYASDFQEVIGRAYAHGVGMVNVGTQKDTSRRAVEVAHNYDGVYAAVGLHPIHTVKSYHDAQELGDNSDAKGFTSRGEDFDYDYYKQLALDSKVVAIGECGFDFFRQEQGANREAQIERQKEAFIKQIELSREVKKPLMIHCREAFSDLISVLKANPHNLKPGIIHFFSGTKEDAKQLLDMGFYFTFGGVITFTRDYDDVIKIIPLDRILSETDAPYVTPVPHRGKRNEPLYVIEVVKKLAEIKNVSEEKMRVQILRNSEQVFNIQF